MKHILFVCTGNTCRSPMAEGIFRMLAKSHGLAFDVRSAGVWAADGQSMSEHSAHILKRKGLQELPLSQSLNEETVQWADLILTMTMNHKAAVIQKFPQKLDKTYTLKEFVALAEADKAMNQGLVDLDIGDPFGGTLDMYENSALEIEEQLNKLVVILNKQHSDQ